MNPFSAAALLEVLTALEEIPGGSLIIGDVDEPVGGATHRTEAELSTSQDDGARFATGICINPQGSEVLAYMRDVACETSVAIQTDGKFTASDYLALGYQRVEMPGDTEFSVWVNTPEVTDRPREWNNPDKWAHPENFDKQRW